MTPEQFKAWQDQHGGPGENTPSPADSQGLVTHRAADGAWMVVGPSGLVSQGPRPGVTDGDASSTAPAPTAALPPGTPVTTDEQLRAWLDQHGGGPGINKNNERQIDGPPDKDTGAPTKVRSVDSTTVTAPDGATLTLRRPAGGQGYEQVAETPPKTTRAAGTGRPANVSTPSSEPNIVTRQPDGSFTTAPNPNYVGLPHTEGMPIAGGGTDNEHPVMIARNAKGDIVSQRELSGPERQAWEEDRQRSRNQGNKTDAQLQAQQGAVTSVATQINGHTYYTVTKAVPATATSPATTTPTFEDENHNPIPSLPVQVKPGEIVKGGGKNGEDVQAVADPAHPGQLQYVAIPGAIPAGRRQLPAGMPTLDTSSPDAAQQSYLAQVAWVQQQRTTGGLSTQEAQDLLTPSYTAAKAVMDKAQQDITNSSTLRGQDLTERGQNLGEVQSRRAAADTGFDSMFTATNGQAAHLGRGNGGLAAAAFRDALALRQGYAQQAGGYADVPATQLSPALASVRTTTVHPDGTVQVQHPVADGPYAPHGAAVGPVAAGVTATTAAAANPTGQNVQAANDATMTGSQAAFGAAGVPAAAPVFAPPPPVNPAAGEPGHNPNAPVGMVPPYLQSARGQAPQWSHDAVVADLRAQGMPEDHIQQALDEYYAEQGAGAAA